jgi:hypothetical protein
MGRPEHEQPEAEAIADAWLAFSAVSILVTILLTTAFWHYVSFNWALAAAMPLAMMVGLAISLVRPARRIVSVIVQFLFGWYVIFS